MSPYPVDPNDRPGEIGPNSIKQPNRGKTTPQRLMILDACEPFQFGLAQALASDNFFQVSKPAASLENLEDLSCTDILVLDVDFMNNRGIEICLDLVSMRPAIRIILLSYHDWDILLAAAQAVRAVGFLVRRESIATLVQKIRQAAFEPIFTPNQISRINQWKQLVAERLRSLKPREWPVVWLVSDGVSNREIAARLNLSENTVEKYLNSLYDKLGISNRSALVSFMYSHHLHFLRNLKNNLVVLSMFS